jgi:hypothetical protein
MQSACARTEFNVSIAAELAIPDACSAVNAFLPIKGRSSVIPAGDGLPGAHFDAHFWFAIAAQFWMGEENMVCISRRRLYLSAHQQGILVGD